MAGANGTMEFHEAANIFPLDDENIVALADDIRDNGQQVAIELFNGKVIDGRRRLLACKMAGKKPITKTVAVDDPVRYVLSLNLHRRHLSETQRGMVAARAREIYDTQAKERQKDHGNTAPGKKSLVEHLPQVSGKARDAVGASVGVSGKTVDYASKVLRHGSDNLIAAVESDKVAVSTAARMSALPDAEQDKWLESAVKNQRNGARRNEVVEPAHDGDDGEVKRKGVGIIRANEAINCLIRIPKNDALRKRGFQVVTDWIRKNR